MLLLKIATVPVLADTTPDVDALDDYARGRVAESDGAFTDAVAAYRQALAIDPESPTIALRSYRQALEAGDFPLALQSAHILDRAGALPPEGPLFLLADALRAKRWDDADQLNGRIEKEQNFAFLTPIVRSWVAFGRDGEVAMPSADATRYGALTGRYLSEHLALQMLAKGRWGEAKALLDDALALQPDGFPGLRLEAAAALGADGQSDGALAVLPPDNRIFAIARVDLARGGKGRKIAKAQRILTPAQGYARLMSRLSVDLGVGNGKSIAVRAARIATFVDPASDGAKVNLARALQLAGRPEQALLELSSVPPASWSAPLGETVRIDALVDARQMEKALAQAQALVAAPGAGTNEYLRLAEILSRNKDDKAAADMYRQAIAQAGDMKAPWTLHLLHGAALEQAGRWQDAVTALETAARLAPDEPAVLNYLGYLQAERGVNLPAALAMLKKASSLKPNDPAITDSLGWAYFMSGDARAAVPLLQRAAAAAPENGTIQEHLGDALWAAGRRFEARYAWEAAQLVAESGDHERLKAKLNAGLAGTDNRRD